jgi:shikimate dehydrogenase
VTAAEHGGHRAAVLGSPIAHSLSPVLHRAAYDALGLTDWSYDAYDVDEAGLASFLSGLDPTWTGLSLTMPLKSVALDLADVVSEVASKVGAANTLLLHDGRRVADNTDVPGLTAALREQGADSIDRATVLGGGATARSALVALADIAAQVTVLARSAHRVAALQATAAAAGVDLRVLDWSQPVDSLAASLVVNTTPAGAADVFVPLLPGRPGLLFDVLYDPWPTPLAAAWSGSGGQVAGGLDLLVHQAVLQVALMTRAGVDIPALVPVLRAAGERALTERRSQPSEG